MNKRKEREGKEEEEKEEEKHARLMRSLASVVPSCGTMVVAVSPEPVFTSNS
jgi:hypothetical protein